MTWQEIREWLAFDELEPIGREWERTGTAVMLHTAAEGRSPFNVRHFKPDPCVMEEEADP